jgi:glycerophosphoryl diester phosphodiesterase
MVIRAIQLKVSETAECPMKQSLAIQPFLGPIMTAVLVNLLIMYCLPTQAQTPIVIAHRGASGYLPEHTLAAKAMAVGMGADYIEQDVVLSKDDVPVVLHDIHLDTVSDVAVRFPDRKREDGRFYAIDFSLAELKLLRLNERTGKEGKQVFPGRYPNGPSALTINSLAEELQMIAGIRLSTGRQVGIYPEIKAPQWHRQQGKDLSKATLAVLESFGYGSTSDQCWLQCFDNSEVQRLRDQLNWKGGLIQLLSNNKESSELLTDQGLQALSKIADGIGPDISLIIGGRSTEDRKITDLVTRAHRFGLLVHPYTVRRDQLPSTVQSLEDLHRLLFLEAAVDGAFTDFPDLTAEYVARLKHSLTKLTNSQPIALWPGNPPGSSTAQGAERDTSDATSKQVDNRYVTRLGDVSQPSITVYPAPAGKNNGAAVLVCPGGGYNILAWDLEGSEVCQWLNSIGVTGVLLKYRVPRADKGNPPIEPLQDAQRALSIVRSRADQWAVDPERIGVLGFSAGGHLAARLSTNYQQRVYESMDSTDAISCRPDFSCLIYPAYLFDKNSDQLVSDSLPINASTPATFLTMAQDDPVDSENVLRYALALKRAKVPVELHLYQQGGHGYGLRLTNLPATSWPDRAYQWLSSTGWLKSKER